MATDISTVKSSIATDGAISSAKGLAQGKGSGIDFAEIIRNNGVRMDSGLNALSDRAGITAVGERPDNIPATDDHSYDRGDERNDNSGNRADADDDSGHGQDRDVSTQSERSNDYGNDRPQNHNQDVAETTGATQEEASYADNHGENAGRDERSGDSSNDEAASAKDSGDETVNSSNGDDGEQTAAKGEDANKNNNANASETGQNSATASTAKQMLNSLLANAQEAAVAGPVVEQGKGNNQEGLGKANAVEEPQAVLIKSRCRFERVILPGVGVAADHIDLLEIAEHAAARTIIERLA